MHDFPNLTEKMFNEKMKTFSEAARLVNQISNIIMQHLLYTNACYDAETLEDLEILIEKLKIKDYMDKDAQEFVDEVKAKLEQLCNEDLLEMCKQVPEKIFSDTFEMKWSKNVDQFKLFFAAKKIVNQIKNIIKQQFTDIKDGDDQGKLDPKTVDELNKILDQLTNLDYQDSESKNVLNEAQNKMEEMWSYGKYEQIAEEGLADTTFKMKEYRTKKLPYVRIWDVPGYDREALYSAEDTTLEERIHKYFL